jgi:hypothetical protein
VSEPPKPPDTPPKPDEAGGVLKADDLSRIAQATALAPPPELDLGEFVPDVENVAELGRFTPRQQPYVPKHAREKTRTWLAIATLSLFGFEIVGPFVLLITHTLNMTEIKELLGIQFAAVASLAGSTLGFYFGSKSAKGDDADG